MFDVPWVAFGQFRNSQSVLISKTELVILVLSILHGFVGIKHDDGQGKCSAVRKPTYRGSFR